ncbi:hypothetical protein ACBG90_18485 [Stutzerimonas kunmingensis]|uniref:hypothetical protein n=1 Tax=Stutzerimonas stutzeri subgroup TaxID=578833 RepID=UPI00052C2119|nr:MULTISPECIES: hypothetical protein [Stutzerimonas stutzeri subgroup]CEG52302.1 hypothetical protein PXNS11_230112 [Stutzerimonas xanthomarina]
MTEGSDQGVWNGADFAVIREIDTYRVGCTPTSPLWEHDSTQFFVGSSLPTGMAVISTAAMHAHPALGAQQFQEICPPPAAIRRTAMS